MSGTNYSGVTVSPLVIPAGHTTASLTGTLIDDGKYDTVNKTLILTLGTPTNATLGAVTADTVTIDESDPPPNLSFANAAQTVNASAGAFSVTVNLSAASNVDTTVPFAVLGTAVSGVDYSGVMAHPLVVPAGQTSGVIMGNLLANGTADKTLIFVLATPINATLGAMTTDTLTIQEPTSPPQTNLPLPIIGNVSQLEGTTGYTAFNFRVSLRTPPQQPLSYDVFTSDGTALSGMNYVGIAPGVSSPRSTGTLMFAAGQVTQTVTVYAVAGSVASTAGNVTFAVDLSNPASPNASLAAGTGTIIPQSGGGGATVPKAVIGNLSQLDGTAGLTTFTFAVALSAAPKQPVTFDVFTTDGSAHAGANYLGITAGVNASLSLGTLTFAPGQSSQTLTVYVIAGSVPVSAGAETFGVNLSSPAQSAIPLATGTGTIIPQNAQLAAGKPTAAPGGVVLTNVQQLGSVVTAAEARWADVGVNPAAFANVQFVVAASLGNHVLANTSGNVISIDAGAAGFGWFIDPTPMDDDEFRRFGSTGLQALPRTLAAGHIDLLTVIEHELGHILGLPDLPLGGADNLMTESLSAGFRRLPARAAVSALDQVFAQIGFDREQK